MLLKNEQWPEVSELVLCTVSKVLPHSVFVNLDEYERTGLIHISEISPGRIRNIREYVKEGKVIVCKVIGVNPEKGHIDVSLRRVSDNQRKKKVNQIKQEQIAEKIIEYLAKNLKKDPKEFKKEICEKILNKKETLYSCFEEVANGTLKLSELGIPEGIAKEMSELINQRIKPAEVTIGGTMKITSYAPDGATLISKAFAKQTKDIPEGVNIETYYEGAGNYRIQVTAKDYKIAEKILKNTTETIIASIGKKGNCSFERKE